MRARGESNIMRSYREIAWEIPAKPSLHDFTIVKNVKKGTAIYVYNNRYSVYILINCGMKFRDYLDI